MIKARGIYKIANLINGKCYVGKSEDIECRKREHFKELNKNIHHSSYLQDDYNKYGKDNFSFDIIEVINDAELMLIAERFYIDKFNTYENGYNMTYPRLLVNNNLGLTRHPKSCIDKIKLSEKHNKYIFIHDELLADIETLLAPSIIYQSFDKLITFVEYLKKSFPELKCTIRYNKSKSKPKQRIAIEIWYFTDMGILYYLNKDIRLLNKGVTGDAFMHPTDMQIKIWKNKLVDIKKLTTFWV